MVSRSRIERVLAPNASPMTLEGTNTYLIFGGREAIAIDPGPTDESHIDAIVAAAARRGATIAAIAVAHSHPDHAPGAAPLHARTGAPVYGHVDGRFPKNHTLAEGEKVTVGDAVLEALETPGHARDHLVFALDEEGALFTGDVVIGRGTVVIAPPYGDMRAYQASLQRLREREGTRTLFGGHGDAIETPREKLDEYIAHRELREREILAQLHEGERTIPEIVAAIYRAVPAMLWPAAARQVLAYLIALEREGRVSERRIERAPSEAESALLNPDLSRIVDPESAAVARAELGIGEKLDVIEAYALI